MTVTDQNLIGFCMQLLGRVGMLDTKTRKAMLLAWCWAEGGWQHNSAAYNPMNTTQDAPGAVPINSVGVKAYTSLQQGLDATEVTLTNGLYTAVLRALQTQDVANWAATVGDSPWGTSGASIAAVMQRAQATVVLLGPPGPPAAALDSEDMPWIIASDGQPTLLVLEGAVIRLLDSAAVTNWENQGAKLVRVETAESLEWQKKL